MIACQRERFGDRVEDPHLLRMQRGPAAPKSEPLIPPINRIDEVAVADPLVIADEYRCASAKGKQSNCRRALAIDQIACMPQSDLRLTFDLRRN